jgi:hypothetical protein
MGSRRRSAKVLLAAGAALLVLAGGGAAAWVAASDDEDGSPFERPVASAPEPTISTPTETEPAPEAPTTPEPEPAPETPGPAAPPKENDEPATGTEKTHFPRERKQSQNDPPKREFAIPPAREFSGTGNASLGTVNLRQPAVVRWTTKGRFELRFGREAFPIIAPSPSGQLVVPPYNFELVRVIASGRWKITITPQK